MIPKFKRILVTSIPGSDWDEVTDERFVTAFGELIKREYGISTEEFSVRDLIYKFAKQEHISLVSNRIHRSSDEKIRLLRRMAFLELEKRLAQPSHSDQTISLIHTRATWYSARGKEESLSRRYLTPIKPDIFVVVIDDPVAIYSRIPKREEIKKYAFLEIDDIVRWMENEVAEMEDLAQDLESPLFVIPRRQVSALVDLIMTEKKPAYVSYAMTQASDASKARIRTVVEKLKTHFVVFDPACMGTAHADTQMTDGELDYYRDNVKKRDEQWFIGINSDYTIVYLPESIPAHGSQKELDTASEQGKTVWVVLEPGYSDERGRLTPFIDQPSDIVFVSSDEFEYFLDLSAEEQSAYARITKTMWGFKRRGNLRPLTTIDSNGRGIPEGVCTQFVQEASKAHSRQVARGMLSAISESRLLDMSEQSWEFNKPFWEATAPLAHVLPLFPEARKSVPSDEAIPRAARAALRPPSREAEAQIPLRQAALKVDLRDEEVFRGVFGSYATGTNSAKWFENLRQFFDQRDLGSFAERIEFLRFVKLTLDTHKYRSPGILDIRNLATWFKEFDAGISEGTRL